MSLIDDDSHFCPICKRDCCVHFTQARARIEELEGLVREATEMALAAQECRTNNCSECYNRAIRFLKKIPLPKTIMERKP